MVDGNSLNSFAARKANDLWPVANLHLGKFKSELTSGCKTRLFAGQTGNVRAENTFAALILSGCRDVKQLRSANEILRIPFQCQSWRDFLWMSLHLLTL